MAGCKTGHHLSGMGKDVTIIEILDDVAIDANIMHRMALMLELEKSVKIKNVPRCNEVTDNGVITVDKQGKQALLEYDTIMHIKPGQALLMSCAAQHGNARQLAIACSPKRSCRQYAPGMTRLFPYDLLIF